MGSAVQTKASQKLADADYVTARSVAAAEDSNCSTDLTPVTTASTVGCRRHQPSAHRAIDVPGGTSVAWILSAASSLRATSCSSIPARQSRLPVTPAPGL